MDMADHLEIAQAVGLVSGYWAQLEHLLCFAFAALLGVDFKLAQVAFYISTNHKVRRDTLMALANELMPDTPAHGRLTEILDDVAKLANRRNDLHHDFWKATPGNKLTRKSFKPASKDRKPVIETSKNILDLARQIQRLGGDVLDFLPYLAEQAATSRKKRPTQLGRLDPSNARPPQ